MIIRRNSKEYKTVRNVIEKLQNNNLRKKWIKLFVVNPGHTLKDKIELRGKKDPEDFFYNLNYTKILESFKDKGRVLHKSEEQPDLYFFNSTHNKEYPENPFELDHNIIDNIDQIKQTADTTRREDKKEKSDPEAERKNEEERRKKKFIQSLGITRSVEFTNLEHQWFSKPTMIKEDVIRYYADERIFTAMRYFVIDRLQSIKIPNHKDLFHSLRNVPENIKKHFPEWVTIKPLPAKSYKEKRPYYLCKDKEHLLLLIQSGCREIHPWLSRWNNLECPDYIVINLNPYEAPFQKVIETGQATIEVLNGLKIPFYIKLSEKKGFHFYVPLNGKNDFSTAKELTQLISKLIHLKAPELTSLNIKEAKTNNQIYLENSQHQQTGTIIAPYSIIDDGKIARVSAPIKPDEINPSLDLDSFTPKTILKRLDQIGDLFSDFRNNQVYASELLKSLLDNYGFLI